MGKGKVLILLLLLGLLFGCTSGEMTPLDEALAFRTALQSAGGCAFLAEVTADYGDEVYTFSLSCDTDHTGTLHFTVTAPESIAGITGTVSGETGNLTFHDTVLSFSALADGQLSPLSAAYTAAQSWRSGYIRTCGVEDGQLVMQVDATYDDNPISTETWLDREKGIPIFAEICYNGRRMLSVTISDFQYTSGND